MLRLWERLHRHRVQLASLLIVGVLTGCDGGANSDANSAVADPNAGKRNKDMRDFMEKQPKDSRPKQGR